MQTSLPLFDEPTPKFDRKLLASRIQQLAQEHVYIGASSWKYQGWLGQIYTPERYSTRGRFSQKKFEEQCLEEYAETFRIVCGDFSFYQFPPPQFWNKLFTTSPPSLHFAFKVPEEITCKTFPSHPRYGPRAGMDNPSFLNAEQFIALFLEPLLPYRERVAVLIFEFGTFSAKAYPDNKDFFAELDAFLAKLPTGWRYSVEVRNPEFLEPLYFAILQEHGVAHVYNAWNRMPPLEKQVAIPESHTANFSVVRGLLRAGRAYEQAVALFSPYEQIQDENPEARDSMRELIREAKRRREALYLFINNRLEGNAPTTMLAITEPESS